MLTFEWDERSERLEIHGDADSLKRLSEQLARLSEGESSDHLHLMSEAWGGDELGKEQQNRDALLINHVKVFRWV